MSLQFSDICIKIDDELLVEAEASVIGEKHLSKALSDNYVFVCLMNYQLECDRSFCMQAFGGLDSSVLSTSFFLYKRTCGSYEGHLRATRSNGLIMVIKENN